jgi:hypothetical protein
VLSASHSSRMCKKQTPLSARKDIRWPSVAKPQALTSKEEAIARECRQSNIKHPDRLPLHSRQDMRVAIQGDTDTRVAKSLTHHLGMHANPQQMRGMRVP